MTALQRRASSAIHRLGDSFSVGGSSGKGIFRVMPYREAEDYLTPSELVTATMPSYLAYVPHDDGSTAGSVLTWNAMSLTIQRVVGLTIRDQTVLKLLVLI